MHYHLLSRLERAISLGSLKAFASKLTVARVICCKYSERAAGAISSSVVIIYLLYVFAIYQNKLLFEYAYINNCYVGHMLFPRSVRVCMYNPDTVAANYFYQIFSQQQQKKKQNPKVQRHRIYIHGDSSISLSL